VAVESVTGTVCVLKASLCTERRGQALTTPSYLGWPGFISGPGECSFSVYFSFIEFLPRHKGAGVA
jgi:hypothetical protein